MKFPKKSFPSAQIWCSVSLYLELGMAHRFKTRITKILYGATAFEPNTKLHAILFEMK